MAWIWTGMAVVSVVCGAVYGRMEAVSAAALEGRAGGPAVSLHGGDAVPVDGAYGGHGPVRTVPAAGTAVPSGAAAAAAPGQPGSGDAGSGDGQCVGQSAGAGQRRHAHGYPGGLPYGTGTEGVASDELCRLVVLNTASIQLLPTTVASIRAVCGSAAPLDILPAVWVSSLLSVAAGLAAAKLLERLGRRRT